jgi:hypothetical protein
MEFPGKQILRTGFRKFIRQCFWGFYLWNRKGGRIGQRDKWNCAVVLNTSVDLFSTTGLKTTKIL